MPEETASKKKFELTPSVSILLVGVLIAGAILYVNFFPARPTVVAGQPARAAVPAPSQEDHWRGSRDASVVLIEYSDFQCPFCTIIHPTLARIVEESDGEIAWVYRHFPLESIHPQAFPSALASECIADALGNDAFWKFADAMFADQSSMSAAYYVALATQFGMNPAEFSSCFSGQEFASLVDAQALEAQGSGGSGTPYTVVYNVENGDTASVSGALPYAQVMAVINSLRARQ